MRGLGNHGSGREGGTDPPSGVVGLRRNQTGGQCGGHPSALGLPVTSLHHPWAPGGLLDGQYAQPMPVSPTGPWESCGPWLQLC